MREVEVLPHLIDKVMEGSRIVVSDIREYFTLDPRHLKRVFDILKDIISSRPALIEDETCSRFLKTKASKLKIREAETLIRQLCGVINDHIGQEDLFQ